MIFKKGHIPWNKNKTDLQTAWNKGKKMTYIHGMLNKKHTIESLQKMSLVHKGQKSWNKGTRGLVKQNSGSFKKGMKGWNKGTVGVMKAWNKGKHNLLMEKEKNPNWKGGITPINEKIRKSIEYITWRETVFAKDNWICSKCGDNKGHNLEAHHIKPFALFPEFRLDVNNGITLCKECHKETDTYLNKNRWHYVATA